MARYDHAMASYTVHLQAGANPEQARFLDDRVSVAALVFPWLYLLWHRLWFAFGLYLLAGIAIALIAGLIGPIGGLALSLLPGLYLFVSAKELVRTKWQETGWPIVATVEAGSLAEAELRYFHGRFRQDIPAGNPEPLAAEQQHAPLPAAARPHQAGIGLFD